MEALMQRQMDPAAVARPPTQHRARRRFEAVLQAAEAMLEADGLAKFSIPLLAEKLGMTRGSVYAYFPTHYAILNELVQRYLLELEQLFLERGEELRALPWREGVRRVVAEAVRFHNARPVARLLILGGAVTDHSYRAQEDLLRRLGAMGRAAWQGDRGLAGAPDIFTLAVDLAVTCFRRSVFEAGVITPAYELAAARAMQLFLAAYLDPLEAPA